jgi:hypothetical protein
MTIPSEKERIVGQDSNTDETSNGSQGISRRTLLKGSAVVGTALWAAPVVETFTGAGVAGASETSAASSDPSALAAEALAAAGALGSQTCTPIWSGYTMPITADCIDPRYNHVPYPQPNVTPQNYQPYIDTDQSGLTTSGPNPVHYRYVHGGFTGTDAKFAFYFPSANQYQGRFFQSTYPLVSPPFGSGGEAESDANIEFSINSGGYAVHTNMGGTEGIMSTADDLVRHLDPSQGAYRVNAAAAKFSRLVAQHIYGSHSPYGYIYGASGGAFQTVAAAENTTGVWDGAVPEVMGTPNSIPSNFTIEIYALRVISQASFAKIVDALAPGGSGDPYAGLSPAEQAALLEATLLGFPPRGWWDYASLSGGTFLLDLTGAYVPALDPGYVDDFWNQPGYEGHDNPSLQSLRIQFPTTVVSVIGSNPPTGLVLAGVLPAGVTGAYLSFTSGAAAGQLVPLGFVTGTTATTTSVTFGIGADPTLDSQIKAGDALVVDNSWFLAFQTYHRHQIPPPHANLYAWDQYRNPDGTPKYPQRELLTGPVSSAGPTGDSSGALFGPGAVQSGLFHGKMIALASAMDDSAFPWSTDWYRQRVEAAQRGNLDKNFRLWYTDNADHGGPPSTAAEAITVDYTGVVQQALRDVAAWVEQGTTPPATTNYQMVDTQPQLAASAGKRRGVQPVVTLTADGAARADIAAGQTVSFTAVAEVPPGAGDIVAAEWDFLGLGTYPVTANIGTPGPTVTLTATYTYASAGTYFPVVRVTSQRQGDPKAAYGLIQNLARARVVVT